MSPFTSLGAHPISTISSTLNSAADVAGTLADFAGNSQYAKDTISQAWNAGYSDFETKDAWEQGRQVGNIFGALDTGVALLKGGSQTKGLPDNAIVCRGGTCTAELFEKGNGGPLSNGKLTDVSVQSGAGLTMEELSKSLPQSKLGATTVGKVRGMGGDVVSSGSAGNPYHSTLQGITPQQAQSLFTPTKINPWSKK